MNTMGGCTFVHVYDWPVEVMEMVGKSAARWVMTLMGARGVHA